MCSRYVFAGLAELLTHIFVHNLRYIRVCMLLLCDPLAHMAPDSALTYTASSACAAAFSPCSRVSRNSFPPRKWSVGHGHVVYSTLT